jgi:hypothetical protein
MPSLFLEPFSQFFWWTVAALLQVFINFITATANDVCKEKKRATINADDVFQALEDLEFAELLPALKESYEGRCPDCAEVGQIPTGCALQHSSSNICRSREAEPLCRQQQSSGRSRSCRTHWQAQLSGVCSGQVA